jgi:hypothetical protein
MTGTGSAMVSTPAIAHSEPTILPQTPTGLQQICQRYRITVQAKPEHFATVKFFYWGTWKE